MHDLLDIIALLGAPVAMIVWLIGLVRCWRGHAKVSLLACLVLLLIPVGMMIGENFFPDDTDYGFIPIIIVVWAAAAFCTAVVGLVFAAGSLWRRRKAS